MDRLISEQAVIKILILLFIGSENFKVAINLIKAIPSAEPITGQYEKHIDHTDCIWYGSDSGCPVTCSQYRDGWNDAMDYIFKNGNGYQPYTRKQGEE